MSRSTPAPAPGCATTAATAGHHLTPAPAQGLDPAPAPVVLGADASGVRGARGTLSRRGLGLLAVATVGAGVTTSVASAGAARAARPVVPVRLVSHDALVRSWYRDLLGRSPAQAAADTGRAYWVGLLDAGTPPRRVLAALLGTRERVERQVASMYLDHLGRGADAGAGAWARGVLAGRWPLEWVLQNVLASGEFLRRQQGATAGTEFVVDAWYQALLGRYRVSGGEEAWWSARIAAAGPLEALRELYYAEEAVTWRVQGHHRALLRRAATAAEVAYWSPREAADDLGVQVAIACTAEYRGDRAY